MAKKVETFWADGYMYTLGNRSMTDAIDNSVGRISLARAIAKARPNGFAVIPPNSYGIVFYGNGARTSAFASDAGGSPQRSPRGLWRGHGRGCKRSAPVVGAKIFAKMRRH